MDLSLDKLDAAGFLQIWQHFDADGKRRLIYANNLCGAHMPEILTTLITIPYNRLFKVFFAEYVFF